jgi:hypothetical protein
MKEESIDTIAQNLIALRNLPNETATRRKSEDSLFAVENIVYETETGRITEYDPSKPDEFYSSIQVEIKYDQKSRNISIGNPAGLGSDTEQTITELESDDPIGVVYRLKQDGKSAYGIESVKTTYLQQQKGDAIIVESIRMANVLEHTAKYGLEVHHVD